LRNLKEVRLELQNPAARFITLMTLWRIRQPTKQLVASPEQLTELVEEAYVANR